MNTTDARVAEYCSRAQERLLHKGKWVGTYGRYRVCINEGCLTWPREIETIEAAALCDVPIDIRSEWYEFLGSGPGVQTEDCGIAQQLIDRGDNVAFDDVKGTGKKLAIYADSASDAGKQVLVRYYRGDTASKVYSTSGSDTIEGEYLTLVAPPAYVYSTYECMAGGFYDAVKPATVRMVRVYQYTVVGGALRPLAYYEPDETNPVYRRSMIPGVSEVGCGEADDECSTRNIDIVGKFRHREVAKDSDALIIQSREALRLMVQAIRAEEDQLEDTAIKREAMAVRILDEQLSHWLGSGAVQPIRMVGSETFGGGVTNLI